MRGKAHDRVRGVSCGKCNRMHTWYKYRVWREGKKLKEEYLGKCDESGNLDAHKREHHSTENSSWQEQFRQWQETTQKSKHNKNPYEILGVPYTATKAQLKTAYLKLVKQFHPDLHPTIDPTIIVDINRAYQTLTK